MDEVIEVYRNGSVEVQHKGASYGVPYYWYSGIKELALQEVNFPDDLDRPHNNFNHIITSEEPTWNPQGVARRLDEIRARGMDMFLVGTTEEPGDSDVIHVFTAPDEDVV